MGKHIHNRHGESEMLSSQHFDLSRIAGAQDFISDRPGNVLFQRLGT